MSRQRKVGLEEMTPEQRAAVERIQATGRTAAARADRERAGAEFADRPSLRQLAERGQLDPATAMTTGAYWSLVEAARALKATREARGLSAAEVARRTGYDPATICRAEATRNARPTFEVLSRYAAALGVPLGVVVGQAPPADPDLAAVLKVVEQIGPGEALRRLVGPRPRRVRRVVISPRFRAVAGRRQRP